MAATPVFKPLSTFFIAKPSYPFLPLLSKPIKLSPLFFASSPSLLLSLTLKRRLPLVSLVAQTSDWAQQEESNTLDGEGFDWEEQPPEEGPEAQVSDWEGEDGEQVAAVGEESGGEDSSESYESEPPEDAKLFVGNLPYDADGNALAELFQQAGIVEVAEVIYNRATDQSRGFGFVSMSTVEEADKAIEMFHRYELGGRLLTVNKAAPRGARVERTRVFEPSYRLYVGNLSWSVDDARLEQVFSEHGKVVQARVVCDRETGRSRGFGFVTMTSQAELDDAIAGLDGQTLDGRALRVNVAEERPRRGGRPDF